LVSIAVSAGSSSLPLGNSEQLTATGTYTDNSKKDLTASATWTSSSSGVVSVSTGGLALAKSVGAAGISASFSNITGSTNLTVSGAALVSIAVSASNSTLPVGTTEQLTATGTYTDNSKKDLTASATWTSSSPSVVSVSSSGAVLARSVGPAGVSASFTNITGSTTLNVSAAALVSITLNVTRYTLPLGSVEQLTATGTYTDNSTKDLTASATWTSSAPTVLTVRGPGLVAGVAIGAAGVTASSGGISGMQSLSVSGAAISSISIVPAGPTVPLGSTLQLAVTGTFTDGSTQDVTQLTTWNVDTPSIASITSAGLATGLQVGSTGIEASVNGVQTSDTLTVQPLLTVAYFDATSGTDSTLRITNPGTTGQNLCAMVYVFDQDQQMSECCGCLVSQDGLLTLSLTNNLLSNPLTGVQSTSGTVMVVSSDQPSSGSCDASSITPAGIMLAWSTHLSQSGTISSAEVPFSSSPLSATLSSSLQAQCSFIQQLGSGQGVCGCGGSQH
jgi:hypothetical protein